MRSWGDETKIFGLGRGASGRSHKSGSGSSRLWNQSESVFVVDLPEGARVSVPAGFDADEVFNLLLVVREALR